MSKFQQVSSNDHQMSVAGEGVGAQLGCLGGGGRCPARISGRSGGRRPSLMSRGQLRLRTVIMPFISQCERALVCWQSSFDISSPIKSCRLIPVNFF